MATATISSITYIEYHEEGRETLLGESYTYRALIDSFVAEFSCGKAGDSMTVWFKPEAIGNRLAGYGLTELEHAIESIVRETVFSLSPSLEPEDPSNRIHVNGGVDERISVKWSGEAAAQAKKLFSKRGKHRAFVEESHERWLNRFGRKEARV